MTVGRPLKIAIAACLLAAGLRAADKAAGVPPLVVDHRAPLLLAEPRKDPSEEGAERPVADNEPCYVCHENFREEPLALGHVKVNVGCTRCHGLSLAHRNDEENLTAPDELFASNKVEACCEKCHTSHDVPAKDVVARAMERAPRKNPADLSCTDCHGMHRLKRRQVRWDPTTHRLVDDGRK